MAGLALLAGWLRPRRRARAQTAAEGAAALLAQLIETSRARAIADGVQPMPPGIRRALLGFFPAMLLDRVRWRAGAQGSWLPGLAFALGHADAMTLNEVVLFKDPQVAVFDTVLWAHEVAHVAQYQRWGVEGFAERYAADREAVEREARETATRFRDWRIGRR